MKNKLFSMGLLLVVILLLAMGGCQDNTVAERAVLTRQGLLNDFAGVFSESEKKVLATMLEGYEKETCHQIIVLTVADLGGESIVDFSSRTAGAWKIGQNYYDNGILISVAIKEGSARIEAGSGLDWIVQDGVAEQIMNQVMIPLFRQNKLFEGIRLGVEGLMAEARKRVYPEDHRPSICK